MPHIISTITVIIVSALVILFPFGLAVGLVFIIKAVYERDNKIKTRDIWIAISSFVGPIVLLFVAISLWGLISIITNSIQNA